MRRHSVKRQEVRRCLMQMLRKLQKKIRKQGAYLKVLVLQKVLNWRIKSRGDLEKNLWLSRKVDLAMEEYLELEK